jgi:phosphoribosyl 1,2-cyclic phosphodiesterase
MDHLQGLPFFAPLRRPGVQVHIWGPASTTSRLSTRLQRYLSPPLFPVSIRELSADLHFHEVPAGQVEIGEFLVDAHLVIHPNPTVGYRIQDAEGTMTYLPDHEPMLGAPVFPRSPEWTSGYAIAEGVDLLIHDSQYTREEYDSRVGFGHSSLGEALRFGEMVGARQFVPFHHDPSHNDDQLDEMVARSVAEVQPTFMVTPGKEGMALTVTKD